MTTMIERIKSGLGAMFGSGGPDITIAQANALHASSERALHKITRALQVVVVGCLVTMLGALYYGNEPIAADMVYLAIAIAVTFIATLLVVMRVNLKRLERANENDFVRAGGGWRDRNSRP
jgi:hypothetical protein